VVAVGLRAFSGQLNGEAEIVGNIDPVFEKVL
jgi:hypothetical protein